MTPFSNDLTGWPLRRLDEVCTVNPRRDLAGMPDSIAISKVPMEAIEAGTGRLDASEHVPLSAVRGKSLTHFREGDVVVAKISPSFENGKVASATGLANGYAVGTTELVVLRPSKELLDRFLLHFLLSPDVRLPLATTFSGTVGQQRISKDQLKSLRIPVPSVDEQRAIVETIERMLSHLDAAAMYGASAATRIPIARAGLLRHLMGNASAEPASLESVVEILDSRRIPVNATERANRPGPVPYYGAAGPVGTIDKALFNEPLVLLGEDGIKFDSPVARKAYSVDGPSWVNNHAHVLRPKPFIRQKWLEAALNAADYNGLYSGTTRLKLNQAQMKKLQLPVPSLEEQDTLLERLSSSQTLLAHAGATAEKLSERSNLLRRSILKAAFEGRLTAGSGTARSLDEALEEIT